MRVLLVDDSFTMRRIQRTQLEEIGIRDIVEAEDGITALSQIEKNWPVDLVILDWNMPSLDGLGFLKAARAVDKYKKVKIVMCTSESEKRKVIEALQAGADNYIVKPFTPEILREKLGLDFE